MLKDVNIYVRPQLQRVGTNNRGTKSRMNYVASYGPMELGGANKSEAIKNIVQALRKMYAEKSLSNDNIEAPSSYDEDCLYTVPAEIIEQDTAEHIDMDLIKKVNNVE